MSALLRFRDEHGFLVVADEVATGFGRVNSWFVSDEWASAPDVIVTSKGLTNGTSACAALLVGRRISSVFDATESVFVHGETQAGTPATCAAILSTIDEMKRLDHEGLTRKVSAGLDEVIARLGSFRFVSGTAGRGCMRAVKLAAADGQPLPADDVMAVVSRIHQAGAIVQPGPGRIQLLPALVYTPENFEELYSAIHAGLSAAELDGVFG